MMIARLTPFTELALIAHRAGAALNPVSRRPCAAQLCRVQVHLINKSTGAGHPVGSPNAYGLDIGQYSHEVLGPQAGSPTELGVLVQAEHIVLQLTARHGVVLLSDGQGDADGCGVATALNNNVLDGWTDDSRPFGSGHRPYLELETQGMVITGPLVPKEADGSEKIGGSVFALVSDGRLLNADKLGVAIKADRAQQAALQSLPVAVAAGEIAHNLT